VPTSRGEAGRGFIVRRSRHRAAVTKSERGSDFFVVLIFSTEGNCQAARPLSLISCLLPTLWYIHVRAIQSRDGGAPQQPKSTL
jgi:hypothetical protein